MFSPTSRAVPLFVALLLAATAAASAEPPRLLRESPDGLEFAWTPEAGLRVERIALPPGRRAVLVEAPPGARLEEGGWQRRTRFVRLVLEPGEAVEQRLRIDFVPDARAFEVESRRPGMLPLLDRSRTRAELFSGELFLNPRTAEAAAAELAESPRLRPRLPARPDRGELRRRSAPRLDAATQPAEWGGRDPAPPSRAGFETGRLLIEVGLPGLATRDRGDGTWRRESVDGIYRISWRQLSDAGHVIDGVPIDELRLTRWGTGPLPVEIAIATLDRNANGVFDDGDAFDFFGEELRSEDCEPCFQRGDFTDVNAYILDAASGPRLRVGAERPAVGGLPPSDDHLRTLRFEVNNRFIGRHGVLANGVDHFYWCGQPQLLWQDGDAPIERTETVELPGLRRGSARGAAVRVNLLTRAPQEHRSLVDVNGFNFSSLDSLGVDLDLHEAALQASDLRADTDVTIHVPGHPAATVNQFELDWIEIEYPSAYEASADRLLFDHEGGATVTVGGFTQTDEVTVFDVTDPAEPVAVALGASDGSSVTFEVETAGRYAVATHPGGEPAVQPLSLSWLPTTSLRDPSNDHDVVAIGPRDWLFEPDGSLRPAVRSWVDLRGAQGLSVLPVAIEDAVAEFTGGVWNPEAVFYLLQEAVVEWDGPPDYAVLFGDTSVDYKGQLEGRVLLPSSCEDIGGGCGFNEPEWIRTVQTYVVDNPGDTEFVGHYAADASMAYVVGLDDVPDVSLGRLPARSAAELDSVLAKQQTYADHVATRPAWASRVHFAGDEIDPSEPSEADIEASQEDARLQHVEPHYTTQTYYFQSDYGALDPTAFTDDFIAGWQDPGAAIVSYVGHGNALNWSDHRLLTNNSGGCRNDVLDHLSDPLAPMPVVLNVGCITGAFMREVGPAMLEEMVRSEGGAIAAYGPTGLTDVSLADTIVGNFFAGIHGRDGRGGRLGDVILRIQTVMGLAGLGGSAQSNALLGDPSLELVVPFGPPADGIALEAVPGDGVVMLSWPAVAGADSYTLHRRTVAPLGPIEIAGSTPGTTFDDTGVVNGTEYEYWLEPFEGAWPGRWSDPGVLARPCTSTPPAPPANLDVTRVVDRIVRLAWDASPTAGIAGYRVRVFAGGEASGVPVAVVDTVSPSLVHGPLDRCRLYTFEVRTLGWCDLESPTATLASARGPDCSLVDDPPRTVRDLTLSRVGDDLQLDWSPITETLSGAPFTLVHYQVHRSDAADFLASPGTLDRTEPAPGTTFVGAGAIGGTTLEFFSVAAEADTGKTGGIGRDFPLGVTDLMVADGGATWSLSWSAVEEDLEGERTALLGYQVHASMTPIDASTAGPGTLVTTVTPDVLSIDVDKALGDFHLVLAEDVHGNLSPF